MCYSVDLMTTFKRIFKPLVFHGGALFFIFYNFCLVLYLFAC